MILVGEAVPHRHALTPELLDGLLREAAVLDAVVHTRQHTGGIPHRFLDADLAAGRPQVGNIRALVESRDLECAARTRRGFLENQRDVLADEALALVAGGLLGFEPCRQVQQVTDFLLVEIQQLQKVTLPQIGFHFVPP